jgi:hypothetical protein
LDNFITQEVPNKMKKSSLLSYIVFTLACVALSGCGSEGTNSSKTSTTTTTNATRTESKQVSTKEVEVNTNMPGGPRSNKEAINKNRPGGPRERNDNQ